MEARIYRGSLGFNLRVAFAALNRRMKKVLAEIGLNLSEFTVLRALDEQDGMSLFEISKTSRRSPTQLTVGVKALAKRGLVRRVASNSDKKIKYLFLTEPGKKILKRSYEVRDKFIGDMGLTPEEAETLCKLTEKMIAADDQSKTSWNAPVSRLTRKEKQRSVASRGRRR